MYPDHNLKIFKTLSQFAHVWYDGICTLDRKMRHFVSPKTLLRFRVRVRAM